MSLRYSFALILLIITSDILFAQADSLSQRKTAVLIKKLTGEIKFDGIPDEVAWKEIPAFRLVMHSPVFGKYPTEETDVRITYDDHYLYIAGKLYYKDPSMIRSSSYKRDYQGMGSDWFGILLDTYNDKENSMAFFTTPEGLRLDANIQRDAVTRLPTDLPMNISWNAFWDVLTKIGPDGWSAEIRVPISSLRFQNKNGEVRMGLTIERWIPSKNEITVYPAIPPNWGPNSVMKPSQSQEIVFNGIKPDKPLYIAPYVLAGYETRYGLNESETGYTRSGKPDFEAGLDVKYGISETLVMDVTVNTDFAQVEADDQQINLTRYSLYFPEKRMFFLERASVFDFSLGGNSNLFYSRRIGLSNIGGMPEPVRILGGARITGRIKNWDVGFLDMQTAPLKEKLSSGITETLIPSENFGALRFRRQVINDNSYVGAMFTSRLGADGSYNLAYGVDGIIRVFGNDYLDVRWSQTFEDGNINNSLKDPTFLQVLWERRTNKGIIYSLGYSQSGANFNPGIGFEMMNDYSVLRATLGYGWISDEKSKLHSHSIESRAIYRRYIDDGTLMNFTNFTGWEFQTKNQWQGNINLVYNYDNLRDSLTISPDELYMVPGEYSYLSIRANITSPMSKPFYAMFMTESGQYFDGNRISFRIQPTLSLSKHFELGGTYNFDHVSVSKRNASMTNHIVGIKALYMLNTKLSVNAFVQYNTSFGGVISNLRLRYNPREGNDFYIVFDEDRNTDLSREVPVLPAYNFRTIMIKYNYTFNL
ncbi:MAG: carbohydrate binding family 9 domain-containing protein [Bacteroidales bacterium]|nr:carbohydrate binding family 9 domain-containing protein [Bacteroidales bacterium]